MINSYKLAHFMENKNTHKKLWFKSKMYGWGWQPCSWEGWAVLALYITTLTVNFINTNKIYTTTPNTIADFTPVFVINTFFLLTICYIKGEKPRWRWGK